MCFPGAGIGDVSVRVEECMAGEGVKPVVCLHMGGNDVGRLGSEELLRRFREALGRIRDKGGIPVVSGVLPRRRVGGMWHSRAIAVNCRLASHCRANGWAFINNWDRFYGRDHLYSRDGVHLSRAGVQLLADSLERGVGTLQGFLG